MRVNEGARKLTRKLKAYMFGSADRMKTAIMVPLP